MRASSSGSSSMDTNIPKRSRAEAPSVPLSGVITARTVYLVSHCSESPSRSRRYPPASRTPRTEDRISSRRRFASSIYMMPPSASSSSPGCSLRLPRRTAASASIEPKRRSSVTLTGTSTHGISVSSRAARPRVDLPLPFSPLTRSPPAFGLTSAIITALFTFSMRQSAANGYPCRLMRQSPCQHFPNQASVPRRDDGAYGVAAQVVPLFSGLPS